MKWFSVSVALFLAVSGARAEGPDDQYLRIYTLIQEADKLNSGGQPSEALPKYLEAQTGLQRLQKGYPDWNVTVVSFRLNYVTAKIAAAPARVPAAVTPVVPVPTGTGAKPAAPPSAVPDQPAPPAPPSDWEFQLRALTDQVRQLQSDKAILEAKVKEALAVQPAAMDPRELARAEEKIRGLLKENELLKVSLAQEKEKPVTAPDRKTLEETQQALAEANRKLAEQTKTANALALEKTALQNKLNNLTATPSNAAELEAAKKALAGANLKLADQSKLAAGLALEKEALQARLKTLNADAEAAAALRAENQLLKKQVADLKAASPPAAKADEASRQLAQAQAQIAALQSDKEMLQLEKIALESRVEQLATAPATQAVSPAPGKTADAARIKQLERERDELQKQLAAANKEIYSRKSKAAAARMAEVENKLATLRSRLEVLDARQVPYSAEELALFKQPETKLAQVDRKDGRKSVKTLPPGAVALVAEANRYYANKQLDKAEEKYLQVLEQDKTSVPTLANLAAIELELGHLETAEINIKQAVALAPDNPNSLFVLGRLKFSQRKYDEAIDAFSRAAKLDPQNAQAQYYLGLTLGEKGLRGPAETALRKAIQIDPAFGDAHNSLAVIYITQQPPLTELARWHYQKALAAGYPKNSELEKLLDATKSAAGAQ
jgi:tetratricopeptide (TPR) repeat protein